MKFLMFLILIGSINTNACILKTRPLKELPVIRSVTLKEGTIIRAVSIVPFRGKVEAKVKAICISGK